MDFVRAEQKDLPVIEELAGIIWRACYPGIISREQIDYMLAKMHSRIRLEADLKACIRYDIVRHEGQPCGYMALECRNDSSTATLHKLYLLPSLQGCGLGQTMLQHALTLARSMGATEVSLRVNKANLRAIRAYERAGFSIKDSIREDIGGGFVMDDFVMSRLAGPP